MSYGNSSLPPSLQAQTRLDRSIAGSANQSPLIAPQSNSSPYQQYGGYPGVSHPGLHQSPYGLNHLNSAYGPLNQNKNAPGGYPPGGYPPGLKPNQQLPSHYPSIQSGGRTAPNTMPNYNQNHSLGQITPSNLYAASPYHHGSPYAPNELWPGQLHQNRLPYPGATYNSTGNSNSSPYPLHSTGYYGSASALPPSGGMPPVGLPQPNSNNAGSLSSDNSLVSNSNSAFNQSPYGRYHGQPPQPQQQQPQQSASGASGLPPGYHSGYDSQTRLSQQQQPYSSSSSSAYGYAKYSGKQRLLSKLSV